MGLVYADIGPSSSKYKKAISSTLELDDSRVEYSHLNHNLKKSAISDGTCYYYTYFCYNVLMTLHIHNQ